MKKSVFLLLGTGLFAFASCNKTEKTTSDTAVVTENTEPVDNEAMYRDRAKEVSRQMARDLQFDADTLMQSQVSKVYYTRAQRRNEARGRYATDTTGMYAEMREIDLEADKEFQRILKPEQYKVYETNRVTYYGGFEETDMPSPGFDTSSYAATTSGAATGSAASTTGSNAKVKTKTEKDGDTKTEIEDGKSQTKIKTDADGETKIKTKERN
ncbi:hypothetical protein I5M27_13950 [Adhaeribacter sp. BT258]|uniref:Lipoprotein n=1 Tax=Adhaeribacter terrigena TaxID=2793070 RepID=A0ABS1C3W6_9BACT|nr:hypothetical protein [Adhaeribacter terrigena]MBK0404094.1 hypothetical protein [Adhaeribacter terrigena]